MCIRDSPIIKPGAEMPEITIFWAANPIAPDLEEMMWIKQNAEETGVHLQWQKNPSEGAVEKVNLLISSGDFPDVFWNTVEPNMVVQYLVQDVFLPTQGLIEEYMPNYKKSSMRAPNTNPCASHRTGTCMALPISKRCMALSIPPGPWSFILSLIHI